MTPTRFAGLLSCLLSLAVAASSQAPSPVHIAPASGVEVTVAQVLRQEVVLSWQSVGGASGYDVEVRGPAGFPTAHMSTSATRQTFPPTTLGGHYDWRVRARVNGDTGPYSAPWLVVVRSPLVEPTPTVTPTPTATPTPHPLARFDLDGSGWIDAGDLVLWARYRRDHDVRGDFDGDGRVDYRDMLRLARAWSMETR